MPSLPALREPTRLPALEAIHLLILSLCQSSHDLQPGEWADLALRLRSMAIAAAEALLRVAAGTGADEANSARRHLRGISHHLDIARRLGFLSLGTAAEILERQTRASLEVELLLHAFGHPEPSADSPDVRRVPSRLRRFRLIGALRRRVAHA